MTRDRRTRKGKQEYEAIKQEALKDAIKDTNNFVDIVKQQYENDASFKNSFLNKITVSSQDISQENNEKNLNIGDQNNNADNFQYKDDLLNVNIDKDIVKAAGGQQNTIMAIQDTVQRHLLPYPNWQQRNFLKPWMPHTYIDLLELYRREPVAFLAIKVLGAELFRKGIMIRPKFWGKCDKCDQKYETKPPYLFLLSEREFNKEGTECENCDKGTIKPPDKKEKTYLEEYIKNVNLNEQSLKDVCREAEKDLNVFDNLYIGLIKKYEYGGDDKLYSEIQEIVRLDPVVMRISSDERGIIGNYAATCLWHRQYIIPLKIKTMGGEEQNNPHMKCPTCGDERLYPVEYIASREGVWGTEEIAYISREVLHANRYDPSSLYGYSPLLVAWDQAVSLIDMTKYIKDYFRNRQIPRGMMFMPGTDKSVRAARETSEVEVKKNPHNIPWFAIPASGDIKAVPQFVSFVNTLQELEYTSVRDEFRLRLTSIYGVSPFMQNDISQGGGLNSEGMQLTITNRSAEHNQSTWNTVEDSPGLFEKITNSIGVYDWELFLPPPEEKDLVAPIERRRKKAELAEIMQRLNYDAQLPEDGLTDETDFVYTRREQTSPYGNDPSSQFPQFDEENQTGQSVTHTHEHPTKPNSQEMHTHEHSHSAGDINNHNHTHKGEGGETTESEQEAQGKPAVHTEEERQDGEPEKPDYKPTKELQGLGKFVNQNNDEKMFFESLKEKMSNTDYLTDQDYKILLQETGYTRFNKEVFKQILNKIDPVDKLANELYQKIANYYRNLIMVMIGGRFANTPLEQLTQMDIMQALVDISKLSREHVTEFGRNFALSSYTLGRLMAETDAETEDELPSITISALLEAGGREDRDALRAYQQAQPFIEAFDGFSLAISNEFREVVRRGFREEKFTLDQLVSQMQDIANTETYRLERIARSEVNRFSNEGRVMAYRRQEQDQERKFRYIWLVTHDDRTSQQCQEIERRVPPDGLLWEELYRVLIDVQTQLMGPNWRPSLLVHPNCRSRPMRLASS